MVGQPTQQMALQRQEQADCTKVYMRDMKRALGMRIVIIFASVFVVFGAIGAEAKGLEKEMVRHKYFMEKGLPEKYQYITPADSSSAEKGKVIYAEHCASCHGVDGSGNGEAGNELYPLPANLRKMAKMRMMGDNFFYWSIADGGEFIETGMPAYAENLSDAEIWSVIAYIRNKI